VNFVEEIASYNLSRLYDPCEFEVRLISTELAADAVNAIAVAYIYPACLITA